MWLVLVLSNQGEGGAEADPHRRHQMPGYVGTSSTQPLLVSTLSPSCVVLTPLSAAAAAAHVSVTPDDFLHAREIYPGSKVREEPHILPTDSRSVSALVPLTPRAARWTPPSASLQVALAARDGRSVLLTSRLVCLSYSLWCGATAGALQASVGGHGRVAVQHALLRRRAPQHPGGEAYTPQRRQFLVVETEGVWPPLIHASAQRRQSARMFNYTVSEDVQLHRPYAHLHAYPPPSPPPSARDDLAPPSPLL